MNISSMLWDDMHFVLSTTTVLSLTTINSNATSSIRYLNTMLLVRTTDVTLLLGQSQSDTTTQQTSTHHACTYNDMLVFVILLRGINFSIVPL